MFNEYVIKPNQTIRIRDFDPDDVGAWKGKKDIGEGQLVELRSELDRLQEMLYAEGKHKVLIIFQAMDTAGKDGTIRSVFSGVNPQGVKVVNFKVPNPAELSHDYLWRVHNQVPGKGELTIFNRSHYEDVLVVFVHRLIDLQECTRRYEQINEFEKMLVDEGTVILKFFLNISLDEQRKRLLERIVTPEKNWKFNPADLAERELWPQYIQAYEKAIAATSTAAAPWHIIPSNHNWYRNVVVASLIVEKLKLLHMVYPSPTEDLAPYRKQLEEKS